MEKLSKKMTLLFSEDMYFQLKEISKLNKKSIGELVRNAITKCYKITTEEERIKSFNELCKIEAPVSDWEIMEREIMEGSLK